MEAAKRNAPQAGTGEANNITNQLVTSNDTADAVRKQALSACPILAQLFKGKFATRPSEVKDITRLFYHSPAPDGVAKDNARFIQPHAEPMEVRAGFKPEACTLLSADFDSGDHAPSEVIAAVGGFFGDSIGAMWSTSSATPIARRWRLLIPMATPCPAERWKRLQIAFSRHCKALGIETDSAVHRPTQFLQLPNVPPAARNPITGEPIFYEHHRFGATLFDVGSLTETAQRVLNSVDAELARVEAERAAQREASRLKREARLASGVQSPIERFNLEHDTEELLERYGYEHDPLRANRWRSPYQASGTFATMVREDGSWFSLSGSDATAGVGVQQGDGIGGDAFALYVHFEHKDDRTAALKAFNPIASTRPQIEPDIGAFTVLAESPLEREERLGDEALNAMQLRRSPLASNQELLKSFLMQSGNPLMKAGGLVPDGRGGYKGSRSNIEAALLEGLCFRFGFDAFRNMVMVAEADATEWRPFNDNDVHHTIVRLERSGFRSATKEAVRDAIFAVAERNTFDSAIDWLSSLRWDGVHRVDEFLVRAFGAEPSEYTTAVSRYTWSALAGRVLQPGVKVDMVPVASGNQGERKSAAIKAIAPFTQAFGELNLAHKEDDTYRLMTGRVVMEMAELSGMRKREIEDLKRFITSCENVWIEKFHTTPTTYLRRCLFIGTTNDDSILTDSTGNRRWLPFKSGVVSRCDPEWVAENRDQLWAEGAAMFRASGVLFADAERLAVQVHDDFTAEDPWEGTVVAWLHSAGLAGVPASREFVTSAEVMHGMGLPTSQINRSAEMRVANVLKRLGYKRTKRRIDGVPRNVYMKPNAENP